MESTYVIAWKSKTEPRWGQGKKFFTREEAETLAEELNEDHPAFLHEALNLAAATPVLASEGTPEPSIIQVDFESAAVEPSAEREAALA